MIADADADAEHHERALLNEYKEKLTVGTRTLPDPLDLKSKVGDRR